MVLLDINRIIVVLFLIFWIIHSWLMRRWIALESTLLSIELIRLLFKLRFLIAYERLNILRLQLLFWLLIIIFILNWLFLLIKRRSDWVSRRLCWVCQVHWHCVHLCSRIRIRQLSIIIILTVIWSLIISTLSRWWSIISWSWRISLI